MSRRNRSADLSTVLLKLYQQLDGVAAAAASELGATCSMGCAHCCYQQTTITFAEAVVIVETLCRDPDWLSWLPRLRSAAAGHLHGGPSKEEHFAKREPCVFLGQDRLCGIYDVRPACCRFHFVVSAPGNCSPWAPPNTPTFTVDMRQLEMTVLELAVQSARELGQDLVVAPIPLMVLHTMNLLVTAEPFASAVHDAFKGLPTPAEWLAKTTSTRS